MLAGKAAPFWARGAGGIGDGEKLWPMGMVMYMRAVPPAEVAGLAADGDALGELLIEDPGSWEADKMWWAALGLLFGPEGPAALPAEPVTEQQLGYTPVMRITHDDVRRLAARLAGVDHAALGERFDQRDLGEPLGPDVLDDDRTWLTDAAAKLVDLLRRAAAAGDDVLFVVT